MDISNMELVVNKASDDSGLDNWFVKDKKSGIILAQVFDEKLANVALTAFEKYKNR